MKYFLYLFLLSNICIAQDTLFLISGKPLVCSVKSANNKRISYTIDNNDSLRFSISVTKIDSAKLKSGFVLDKNIFFSNHIHSKYNNSFNSSLIDKTVNIKQLVSINSFGFLNHKIQMEYSYFLKRKAFAFTSNFIYNYNYRSNEFRRSSNDYSTVFGFGIGLKVLNYINDRNAIFFMPTIHYQKFWKEQSFSVLVGSHNGPFGMVNDYNYYTNSIYNEAIIPSLYFGGIFFFTDNIFLSPVFGFGIPIELSSRKDIATITQFQLNIGMKIK